ncbi:hypothetical protein GHT06_011264 [Daphnia sinensis]|uniref:ZZ-type domain-containing protein n=1 Tax=Daphnia sinensis TaxID=1820382 RepID=A0AAD5L1Y6_9CRUS|nr:hypothetical protein GHT06_011264 [Daphnia sinensis]
MFFKPSQRIGSKKCSHSWSTVPASLVKRKKTSMLSLNHIMNMPEVTLTFKCGVMASDGTVDANSYKFLTWSYVTGNTTSTTDTASFSHISLGQRVLSVYPQLADVPTRIVYVDEENDRIAIPCDNIKETLAALRVITHGHLDDQENPIRIFIQITSPSVAGNCQGNPHLNVICSSCKNQLVGFVYKCLECDGDLTLCGQCDTSGKHPEHVFIRFAGDQPVCLPEMKQLLSKRYEGSACEMTKIKLKTCTLRVM